MSGRPSVVPEASCGTIYLFDSASGRLALRAGVNRILLRPDGPLKRELADVRGVRTVAADYAGTVTYHDSNPWPSLPDGTGYTS